MRAGWVGVWSKRISLWKCTMWRAWIILELCFIRAHIEKEILLWRCWNTWIIARMNIKECIKRFLCEASQKNRREKKAYIQLWHTERSEYVYRKKWGAKEERTTQSLVNDPQCTWFFDMPRTLFSFLTLLILSKLSYQYEKKILFFYFDSHTLPKNKLCVCAFFRKGGMGEFFLPLLDYNIILLLLCFSFPFKNSFFSVIK